MAAFNLTVSANTQNFNLNTALVAAGWNGTDVVEATITVNAGVYVWSDSTSIAGMSITTLPANSTVALINNGFVMGKGGSGGAGNGLGWVSGTTPAACNGLAGGPAISLANNITITNNSYIAGGGGGGVGGAYDGGGGGAGGGAAGSGKWTFGGLAAAGGAGGAIGQSGANGSISNLNAFQVCGGGGGGRILPGTGGGPASPSPLGGRGGGAGGGGGAASGGNGFVGGPGGSRNAPANFVGFETSGGDGQQSSGGGGWGAAGGNSYNESFRNTVAAFGGAGGKSIALNGYTVTFITAGIIYGEFS